MKIEELLDADSTLTVWRDVNEIISVELWRPSGAVVARGITVVEALEKLVVTMENKSE